MTVKTFFLYWHLTWHMKFWGWHHFKTRNKEKVSHPDNKGVILWLKKILSKHLQQVSDRLGRKLFLRWFVQVAKLYMLAYLGKLTLQYFLPRHLNHSHQFLSEFLLLLISTDSSVDNKIIANKCDMIYLLSHLSSTNGFNSLLFVLLFHPELVKSHMKNYSN